MRFIVLGLARCRTAWLSRFLTYGDHICTHELAMYMDTPSHYKDFFARGNVGSSETGVAQGWCLLKYIAPDLRTVIVQRPIEECIDSLLKLDLGGKFHYDVPMLRKHLVKAKRSLDRIAKHPDTLVVNFHDLEKEETCQRVFEHCLPYIYNSAHWNNLKDKNIQMNFFEHIQDYHKRLPKVQEFKRLCKLELIRIRRSDPLNPLWSV